MIKNSCTFLAKFCMQVWQVFSPEKLCLNQRGSKILFRWKTSDYLFDSYVVLIFHTISPFILSILDEYKTINNFQSECLAILREFIGIKFISIKKINGVLQCPWMCISLTISQSYVNISFALRHWQKNYAHGYQNAIYIVQSIAIFMNFEELLK